ncbi:DUF4355 domain-containing protein [Clostridium sp. AWRP]|uniref:DUF4355 domain-containing protein n=1 Tax=Clostridium sp. AWRP TaxID=2212991 RepID=UPI000FDC5831|nr:DUF4355 domain-containing protein [Clostridium sp. AWRP]AZV58942.1 DUF4355 domain-containing protein [Clostridium sp. AWRP]
METNLNTNAGMENQNNLGGSDEKNNSAAESNQTEKTFNQDDVNKIIGDRLYKERAKWEKDFGERLKEAEKTAKMTADEKAQHELEKREQEISRKEAELFKRELRTKVFNVLREKKLPEDLIDIIAGDDEETLLQNIDKVADIFSKYETNIKTEFLKQNSYIPPHSTENLNYDSDPFLAGLNKK